jgi:hypothetical protein
MSRGPVLGALVAVSEADADSVTDSDAVAAGVGASNFDSRQSTN